MLFENLKKILFKNNTIARLFRHKFMPADFLPQERLYRGFRETECDETTGVLMANTINFPLPDCSCNWSRLSRPIDVGRRVGGLPTDGCYSFTVRDARFQEKATPCHDLFPPSDPENYAHVEVRQLLPEEDIFFEPPHDRRLEREIEGWSRSQRLEYRQNIVLNLLRELEPIA